MNQEDFTRVLETIPDLKIRKWKNNDVRFLFKIMYWSALRPMEAIRLEKKDFNFENRVIHLGHTKTRENDQALIPRVFHQELAAWVNTKESGRVFPELKYITFYVWLKRLGKILDIEAWTTPQSETGEKTVGHIFRKSIGKDMMDGVQTNIEGKPFEIHTISKHLRHAKPSITQDHYLKSSLQRVKEQF